jgi:hypothetical protein
VDALIGDARVPELRLVVAFAFCTATTGPDCGPPFTLDGDPDPATIHVGTLAVGDDPEAQALVADVGYAWVEPSHEVVLTAIEPPGTGIYIVYSELPTTTTTTTTTTTP